MGGFIQHRLGSLVPVCLAVWIGVAHAPLPVCAGSVPPVRWNRNLIASPVGSLVAEPPAFTGDGGMLVAASHGQVWCLDVDDGSIRWTAPMTGPAAEVPIVAGPGNIAVYAANPAAGTGMPRGRLVGFRSTDGNVLWSRSENSQVLAVATMPGGGTWILTERDLVRMRLADGSVDRRIVLLGRQGGFPLRSSGALMIAHGVVVVAVDAGLVAVDAWTGRIRWETSTAAGLEPVSGPDGTILTGGGVREVRAYAALDGRPVATLVPDGGSDAWVTAVRSGFDGSIIAGVVSSTPESPGQSFRASRVVRWAGMADPVEVLFRPVERPFFFRAAGRSPLCLSERSEIHGHFSALDVDARRLEPGGGPATLLWSFEAAVRAMTIAPDGELVLIHSDRVSVHPGGAPPRTTGWPQRHRDPANSGCDPSAFVDGPRIQQLSGPDGLAVGDPLELTAVVFGERPMEFTWYRDGELVGTGTEPDLRIGSAVSEAMGGYSLVASNRLGVVTNGPVMVTVGRRLLLGIRGTGSVLVDGKPHGRGTLIIPDGTTVRLRAEGVDGTRFLGWADPGGGTDPDRELTVTGDASVLASFDPRPGDLRWWVPFGADLSAYAAVPPAVLAPSRVIVRAASHVMGLDSATGASVWTVTSAPVPGFSSVAVSPGGAAFAVVNGRLEARDGETGDLRWTSPALRSGFAVGPVIAGFEDRVLVARRAEDGMLLWRNTSVPVAQAESTELWIEDEVLRVGSMRTLDLWTGSDVASDATAHRPVLSDRVLPGPGSRIYHNAGLRYVVVDRMAPPTIRWTERSLGANALSVSDDLLAVLGVHPTDRAINIDALDPVTGGRRWSVSRVGITFGSALPVVGAPVITARGDVWVATPSDLALHDGESGVEVMRVGLTDWYGRSLGPVVAPLRAGPEGTLFCVTGSAVLAFEGSGAVAAGPWAQADGNHRGSREAGPYRPLLDQPVDWMHAVGVPVSVRVPLAGRPPPTLHWERDGVPLTGQTNAVLAFPAFLHGDAGAFRLVARNAAGESSTRVFRLLAGDLPGGWGMGLAGRASSAAEVHLQSAPAPEGPWEDLGPVDVTPSSVELPGADPTVDPGRFYRLQSSNVIEMELTARPVFGFLLPERPAGVGYRVEYVDPSTGWETWQSLGEVSAGTPRRWYADPTQAPLTPRFYRLVPLP